MRTIKLTKSQTTKVDNDVYEYLNQFKWYAHGTNTKSYYAATDFYRRKGHEYFGKKTIFIQNMIMWLDGKEIPKGFRVDHIDRNKQNNLRSNFRLASPRENTLNVGKKHKDTTSKYRGVFTNSTSTKKTSWCVQIKLNYKSNHIATVYNEIQAAKIFDQAATYYFKKFAVLNFPKGKCTPKSIEELKLIYKKR